MARHLNTSKLAQRLLPALLLASFICISPPLCAHAAPIGTRTSTGAEPSPTVPYASDDPNIPLWNAHSDIVPEGRRGTYGASVLGPQNVPVALQNTDLLAPPTTDHGDMYVLVCEMVSRRLTRFRRPNAKWPFALSHNRLQTGGWARQQNGMLCFRPKV